MIKDYVHLQTIIKDHQNGNLITLPPFHGCGHRNKNGTRKLIDYAHGYRCITPSWRNYWKKDVRPKYRRKIGDFYVTRYIPEQNLDIYLRIKAAKSIILNYENTNTSIGRHYNTNLS